MMTALQWLLLALGGANVLRCWLSRELDAPEDQPHQVSFGRIARALIVTGYVVCALLAPLAHLTGASAAGWYLTILALTFALLAPSPFLFAIRYGESGLTLRSWYGVIHHLRWEDVLYVPSFSADNSHYMFLRTADRRFLLNPLMGGCAEFVSYTRTRLEESLNP